MREIRFEYSQAFPGVLQSLPAALLISTYQAGKLAVVGTQRGKLSFTCHHFEQAMGIATSPRRIAVGARRQIHFLRPAHPCAAEVPPRGTFDACWLARQSHVTGAIHGHEIAFGSEGLWVVNTAFSCLATLAEDCSFVPRWRPPFITKLAPEDRCHLNGLAIAEGRPRFVTAHAPSNEPEGWRALKATAGCVIDVASGQTLLGGLCMPHSPRWHQGRLWVLDSGTGRLLSVDPTTGRAEPVESFPGYARGMALWRQFAFVGLSKIRASSVFGGVPLAERRDALRCGVAVVDLTVGRTVGMFEFHSGVEEIFAVALLPECLHPVLCGPSAEDVNHQDIWMVPPQGPQESPPPAGPPGP